MEKNEKTLLLIGGLGLGALVLFSLMKQSQMNRMAYANQPGLITQPGYAAKAGASEVILSGADALSNLISSWGRNNSDLNDPGLEYDDATSFPGMDYTYANSNSYAPGSGSKAASGSTLGDSFDSSDSLDGW